MITDIDLNTLKKQVYKQQPKAKLQRIRLGVAYYNFDVINDENIRFGFACEIPVIDMGDADFEVEMEAKLLLRWVKPTVIYFNHVNSK